MKLFIWNNRTQSHWLKWLAIALMVGIAQQLSVRSSLVVVEYLMEGESIRTLYRTHFGTYPWQGPAQTVLWVVILTPLIEEFCFRNWLFRLLRRFTNAIVSGLCCTLLFAAIHLQHPTDPLHWVFLGWIVVMGASFQLLYCVSGSTWPPILAHATVNAIAIAPLPMLGPVLNKWGFTGMQSKALFMSGVLLIAVSALAWCGQSLVKHLPRSVEGPSRQPPTSLNPLTLGQRLGWYCASTIYGVCVAFIASTSKEPLSALWQSEAWVPVSVFGFMWLTGVVLLRYYVQDKDPSNLRSLLGLSKHKNPR